MPIPYKKPYNQGRRSTSGGPRDQQQRQLQVASVDQDQIDLIASLKEQIKLLKNTSQFTNEQINDEIIKVVKEETIKYKEQVDKLKSENDKLKNELENKNILIEQLKEISPRAVEVQSISDRPEIKPIFIDPIEKEFKSVESHIKIEEVSNTGKEDTLDKVNKLKTLLGKV